MLRPILLTITLVLATGGVAAAVCGDVTGEGERTAGDALAVLRSAVGQPVELECTCEDCVATTTTMPPPPCCQGSTTPCSAFGTQFGCLSQAGCSWSGSACFGTPPACATFQSAGSCESQTGCVWTCD